MDPKEEKGANNVAPFGSAARDGGGVSQVTPNSFPLLSFSLLSFALPFPLLLFFSFFFLFSFLWFVVVFFMLIILLLFSIIIIISLILVVLVLLFFVSFATHGAPPHLPTTVIARLALTTAVSRCQALHPVALGPVPPSMVVPHVVSSRCCCCTYGFPTFLLTCGLGWAALT